MNSKKYLIAFVTLSAAFALVFAFPSDASAKANNNKNGPQKRVIAHTEEEVNKAVSSGCEVVRDAKVLKALRCPKEVSDSLSLSDDVQVFALGDEAKTEDADKNADKDSKSDRKADKDSNKDKDSDNNADDVEDANVSSAANSQVGALSSAANTQIGANIVQASGNTGKGRKVVVLDTGYNYLHPELVSSYLGGKDFINNDNDPMDDQGHGSHVAGIITADGVNPSAKGVAPDAGVIAGKVLDSTGAGYFSDVVAGIYWAVNGPDGVYGTADDFGADAISLSLGTAAPYTYTNGNCDTVLPDLTAAIKYATSKKVAVVVAAGNSGSSGVSIPGCISSATTVGAVDGNDTVASFSGRGKALDITAPGVNILSSVLGNLYDSWSGTSMATPMVTGVVALVKKAHPNYSVAQVESKLFNTAKDLGKRGKDNDYGYGRVKANAAVK